MSKYYNWKEGVTNEELNEVVNIIKDNGIIIFPTETVYGIGGNALSYNVVNKIYEIKQRPREKALTILVKSKEEITKYAEITNEIEMEIIKNFMPGPITLILKKKKDVIIDSVTAGNNTIGVRIPDNIIVKKILERCDVPIAAPSANISGRPSSINLEDIIKDFDGKVDALIDGGVCKEKIASTIVQVCNGDIKILREGVISINDIIKKLNKGVKGDVICI